MSSVFVSSPSEIVVIDSRTRSGTITLPPTNAIPYRVLNFKDQYGAFSNSTLTLSTQTGETFDDGTTTKTFSNAFTYVSLYATPSRWMIMNATQTTQQTISSLTVNQLNFGTGAGWIQFGPIQTSIISTTQANIQSNYTNNLFLGTTSSATALEYFGLTGAYTNTVLAEISTGAGIQEFLIFKGSSVSDRVRVQTTGNFVVETGVSARTWNDNTTATLSNVTPAFIVNSSSNVGIQTATPATTLDVAGTARAITMSTQAFFMSSINGTVLGTPASTVALFTSNTSNWASNILQNWSSALSTVALFASNSAGAPAVNFSTPLSTVALFTSNTSNWAANFGQNFSTPLSTVALFTSNTSNWAANFGQNFSTPLSTIALFTSNTSNWTNNILITHNISSAVSSVALFTSNTSNWATNFGQNFSTPLSTVALFTSNTSNFALNTSNWATGLAQNWSTPVSTVALFTSNTSNFALNTSNWAAGALQNWSTPLSTATLYTSNTSNWAANFGQNFSTPLSTVALFTSNTSNWTTGLAQNFSTPLSTVALFTSNTSNFASGILQNFSTPLSTVAQFTSNTSNFAQNILQNFSTPLSTVALFTSNTSNFAQNILQNFSTPLSTVAQFTSNTSNFAQNILQNWSIAVSTTALFTSNTSNWAANFGQNWSTPLASTSIGLGSLGYISTQQLTSTTQGLQVLVSSFIDPTELTSSIIGLGTIGYFSTIGAFSTVTGLQNYISSFIDQNELASTVVGLGTVGFVSTLGLNSTVSGIQVQNGMNSSSFSTAIGTRFYSQSTSVSSLAANNLFSLQGSISSLQINALTIGTGTGFINMGDIIATSLSTIQVNTNTLYAMNTLLGTNSTNTDIEFFGLTGQFNNTVIAEQSTGTGTQDLILFKGSSISDRIRLRTTGAIVFEPGSAASIWPRALANPTPAMVITTTSNVGIGLTAANTGSLLDVGGQGRFVIASTQQIFTSSIAATNVSTIFATVSNATAFTISTGTASLSTITLVDSSNAVGYSLRVSSALLYYSSFVVAGTRQMVGQTFAF